MSQATKVKTIAFKISFLMPHQQVVPDLAELVAELASEGEVDTNSPEYLRGAHDALEILIIGLQKKGFRNS